MRALAQSCAKPELLQVGRDGSIQLRRFSLLRAQRLGEPRHLIVEPLTIVLGCSRANITTGCEHMTELADVVKLRRHAEAWHIRVFASRFVPSPSVVGRSNLADVPISQIEVRSIHH